MKTTFVWVIVFAIFSSIDARGQRAGEIADTALARRTYEKAIDLKVAAQYDTAIALFGRAETLYARAARLGLSVRCRIGKAACFEAAGSYDKAMGSLAIGKPAEDALLKEDPSAAVQRLAVLGSIGRDKGKFDSALVIARNAQALQVALAPTDTSLAWAIYSLMEGAWSDAGELDSALDYSSMALRLYPSPRTPDAQLNVSSTYNGIATVYQARGNYRKALEYFDRALAMRKAVLGEMHPDIAALYNNVGSIYFRSGDFDLSIEYYLKSLAIMSNILPPDHPSYGVRYNNLAMSYRGKEDFDKAIEYGRKSEEIFVKRLGDKHPNVAGVINNIGRTYFDMRQYDRALESYKEALAIWEEKLGPKHPNVSQSYFNIGETYGKLGDASNAVLWLQKSLLVRIETMGEKNVKVGQTYNALGSVYLNKSKPDSAMLFYQRAMVSLVEGFDDSNVVANPPIVNSASDLDLLAALTGKAEAFSHASIGKLKRENLGHALDAYELGAQLVEKIRRDLSGEGSKLVFGRLSFTVYEEGIETALKMHSVTKDPAYVSAAFSFAERSKAGILKDAINQSEAQRFAGIPDSLLEHESSLRVDITYYETLVQKEKEKKAKADGTKIARWDSVLFGLREKSRNILAEFEKDYPSYYELKHQATDVTVDEIQKRLPDARTALVEYVAGDSTVVVFAVTKGGCVAEAERVPSLPDLVGQFRRSIQNVQDDEYLSLANILYGNLVLPVRSALKGVKKIFIVPDGVLHYLPFEALLTKKTKAGPLADYSRLPYLMNEFEVSYQVSATRLRDRSTEKPDISRRSLLAMAPVFEEAPSHAKAVYAAATDKVRRSRNIGGEEFAPLKESEHEATSIAAIFRTNGQRADLLLRDSAQESVIKAPSVGSYGFLHIATHALINEDKPAFSGIVFAAPGKSSAEDGVLYCGEAYNLRLNADLVVLSACETGLGTLAKGEGILGLTRGFLYAGAKNIVVSLWQVGDKSTSDLMVEFYRNILKGEKYSTALRDAKLSLVTHGRYAHPIEWAPFVLTGR